MFRNFANKVAVSVARSLVKERTQSRIDIISKEQADWYLKNSREASDKEKQTLSAFYAKNSQSLDNYVYDVFANRVTADNQGYHMNGKYYKHKDIAQSFAQQNYVMDSKAWDAPTRNTGNLLTAASSYNNFAAPQVDDSILSALGYETAVGNKVLRRMAQMILGKGFYFVGQDEEKTGQLNDMLADEELNIFQTIIDLLMQNFCYGGAFLVPVVDDWSEDDYATPFIPSKFFLRPGTITGFNVVNRRFITPMYWQTWDATKAKYYKAYQYIQYGHLIDPKRMIKLTTGNLPEFLSSSYLLNGISYLQLFLKYIVFHNTAVSSANNILIGNSIFIYESGQISANENEKRQLDTFQNNRTSPTGLLRINHGAKVYVASIALAHYDEMLTKSLTLLPTFMGDSVSIFMGTSQTGQSMIAKEGSQDTKNLYNSIEFLKKLTGYDTLKSQLNNWLQLNCDGKIDKNIKIEEVPVDTDLYRDELEVATLEMEYKKEWAELMLSLGVKRQNIIKIVTESAKQSKVSPIATELQDQELELISDDEFKQMNMKNNNSNNGVKPGETAKKVVQGTKK